MKVDNPKVCVCLLLYSSSGWQWPLYDECFWCAVLAEAAAPPPGSFLCSDYIHMSPLNHPSSRLDLSSERRLVPNTFRDILEENTVSTLSKLLRDLAVRKSWSSPFFKTENSVRITPPLTQELDVHSKGRTDTKKGHKICCATHV